VIELDHWSNNLYVNHSSILRDHLPDLLGLEKLRYLLVLHPFLGLDLVKYVEYCGIGGFLVDTQSQKKILNS
jgi:hypothetical protein